MEGEVVETIRRLLRPGAPLSLDSLVLASGRDRRSLGAVLLTATRDGDVRMLPNATGRWYASAPDVRRRVPAMVHRLLTVAGPLSVTILRIAWRRQSRLRGFIDLGAPEEVICDWLQAFLEFEVVDDVVAVREPGAVPLDETTAILVEVLRRYPDGCSRAQLRDECLRRGVAPGTFATTLSYSPCVAHVARDRWTLPSEAMLSGTRTPSAARAPIQRQARAVTFAWSHDGRLILRGVLSSVESPVLHVPSEVGRFLEGRRFQWEVRPPTGDLAISRATVWGFGPFVARVGAQRGDAIHLSFDLLRGTASASIARAADSTTE